MGRLYTLLVLGGLLVLPSFGASLRMEMLGEVQLEQAAAQKNTAERAGFAAVESISFPHHFAMDAGSDTLLFRNQSSGETIALKCKNFGNDIEVTPLLWRELTNDGLGAGQRFSWSSGSASNHQAKARTSWQAFEPDSASIASAELPVFKYKRNGKIESTGSTNRTLVEVSKIFPFVRTTLPGVAVAEPSESDLKYAYTYELPDGRISTIIDNGGTLPTESLTVNISDGLLPFQINYTDSAGEGFRDSTYGAQRRAAMEYATANWAHSLFGNVPVVINASLDPLGTGILGQCGPLAIGVSDPGDTEFDHVNTGYVSALANQLLGSDFFDSTADIQVTFSTAYLDEFYFGTDGNVPFDKSYDFVTIVTHELAHGLGFIDGLDSDGSFYYGGSPFVFDHLLYYNGNPVVNLSQSQRATAITSDQLLWDGSHAKAANGGARIEMYAPSSYSPGSSVAHWDTDIPFVSFMGPYYTDVIHTIDDQLLGAMQDMEWSFGYSYEAWLADWNVPAAKQGELDDPAGDGIENIWKFAAGLDPMSYYPRNAVYTYVADPAANKFSVTYYLAKNRPQVSVDPGWDDALPYATWSTNGITSEMVSETTDKETWKITAPMDGSEGFIRLQAELK